MCAAGRPRATALRAAAAAAVSLAAACAEATW